MTMRQCWLDKSKPKEAFRLTQIIAKNLLWNFKRKYLMEFSARLMPSDKCNSIITKAADLIFLLFDIASA